MPNGFERQFCCHRLFVPSRADLVRLRTSVRVNSGRVIFNDSDHSSNLAGELSLELARESAL